MKIKKRMMVNVMVEVCNICKKEIDSNPFNKTRIDIVKHLFKTDNFNAHEKCINGIVINAFKEYFAPIKK